ncbi:hypothetical protein ACJX0J_017130 [Zea mays]
MNDTIAHTSSCEILKGISLIIFISLYILLIFGLEVFSNKFCMSHELFISLGCYLDFWSLWGWQIILFFGVEQIQQNSIDKDGNVLYFHYYLCFIIDKDKCCPIEN